MSDMLQQSQGAGSGAQPAGGADQLPRSAGAYAVGVDVGGTKINAGVVDAEGNVLHRISLDTMAGRADTGERVVAAVDRLMSETLGADAPWRGIGVGTAGQVDRVSGSIRSASDLIPGYAGTPLRELLQDRYRLPVRVDNDVNVLALTEQRLGAARGVRSFVCLALGTGVGGAVVADGALLHGAWGAAGELGHLCVDFRGAPCVCGGRGCLELFASGTGIRDRMNERLAASGGAGRCADAREVFERWRGGDPAAAAIIGDAAAALGSAAASLIHAFNPELIVIGGGLAEAGEPLLAGIRAETAKRTMPALMAGVRIEPAYRGNWSGMIGAALQVWQPAGRDAE
ncbi:ROK family protein [Cohnella sp. JJ-181]|uniref:ROK family protein n=1 Tax=Cohnella rhizoplanae TaxID=2974897 RepID=UPI0022FF5FDD|nr:ROK family protein [Cohnella sp. JJ-181]CAI6066472.1 Glucokinase [Cohnella sp. JJ-181]